MFDKPLKMVIPWLDEEMKMDNSKIKAELGYQPRDLKTSIIDMAYNLIDMGFIKKTKEYENMKKEMSESGEKSVS